MPGIYIGGRSPIHSKDRQNISIRAANQKLEIIKEKCKKCNHHKAIRTINSHGLTTKQKCTKCKTRTK